MGFAKRYQCGAGYLRAPCLGPSRRGRSRRVRAPRRAGRQADAEAAQYRAAALAPAYREALDLQAAAELARSARLERQQQRQREQRQADAEDYVAHLLRTGHRWHTVSEALSLEAGRPIDIGY